MCEGNSSYDVGEQRRPNSVGSKFSWLELLERMKIIPKAWTVKTIWNNRKCNLESCCPIKREEEGEEYEEEEK